MYIIVIGGGRVGYYLARALLDEGHEILVVEKDAARTDFICGELGSVCVRGDGCEVSTLTDVGTGRADITRTETSCLRRASPRARALITVAIMPMWSAMTRSIRRADSDRPRKMLPPPTTTAS